MHSNHQRSTSLFQNSDNSLQFETTVIKDDGYRKRSQILNFLNPEKN